MIMQTKLPLSKKILFSLIIVISFFLTLELTIRVYHSVKFREKSYFFYGGTFFKTLLKEGFIKFKAIYNPNETLKEADDVFLNRNESFKITPEDYLAHFRRWDWYAIDKKPDTIRMVAMGGSFVYGVALTDTETFPYLLGEELNNYYKTNKYEVMNCSQGGKTINDILVWFIKYVVPLKPDYLILFSAYNNHALVNLDYKVSFAWRLSHFLYNTSRFYSTVRDKVALVISKDIYFFHDNYSVTITKDGAETAVNLYKNRLKQILTVCRENNIKLILGLQPMFLPENLKDLDNLLNEKQLAKLDEKIKKKGLLSYYEFKYYMQGRYNFEMKHFAEKNDIPLFDGVNIFPEDRHLYFIDPIHLNRKGTVILAKELFLFFVKNST